MSITTGPAGSAWKLPRAAAFLLLTSVTVSFIAGAIAPTPLYAIYRARWHFTSTMLTVVFGIYAVAVVASLLVAGRLSDYLGRRPVLLGGIAVQICTMILFAEARDLDWLIVARVFQGLSAGATLSAIGAGLLDIDKTHGSVANAVTPPVGTAVGAIASGTFVQYFAHPTQLVYAVLAVVLALQGVAVFFMGETHAPRAGALASLRPHLRLSPAVRRALWLGAPALVAAWAHVGLYASLGPYLVQTQFKASTLVGSLSLFAMASGGAVTTWLMRDLSSIRLMRTGGVLLAMGVAGIIVSLPLHARALLWTALPVAGAGFGAGFQGAVRMIAEHAQAHERAGALSIAFMISYLAFGLPAIAAGYLATRYGDLIATASEFGVVVILLALASLAATFARR